MQWGSMEFHDGPDVEWIKDQLDMEKRRGERQKEQTSQDVEARYEEDQEQKRSLGYGDSEVDQDQTLRREELMDARELRGANVNMILRQLGVTPREEKRFLVLMCNL